MRKAIIPIFRALAETSEPRCLAACTSDACSAGRLPCPTPQACRIAIDETFQRASTTLVAIGLVLAVASVVVLSTFRLLPGEEPFVAALQEVCTKPAVVTASTSGAPR